MSGALRSARARSGGNRDPYLPVAGRFGRPEGGIRQVAWHSLRFLPGAARLRGRLFGAGVRNRVSALVDWAFPGEPGCLWCGRPGPWRAGAGLCTACWRRVPWVQGPVCRRCGKPLARPGTCRDCSARPVPVALSRAPALYDGVWKDLIHALKFAGRQELCEPIGEAMARCARRAGYPERCHALVPVPLAPSRLQRRGYNQAELLARQVGARTAVPVLPVLARTAKPAPSPQSLKSARERRRSLRGAFVTVRPDVVRGLTLAVVDDVYTTGATMDEASRALLRAGAREVVGLVAAVGLTDRDLDRPEGAGASGQVGWRRAGA